MPRLRTLVTTVALLAVVAVLCGCGKKTTQELPPSNPPGEGTTAPVVQLPPVKKKEPEPPVPKKADPPVTAEPQNLTKVVLGVSEFKKGGEIKTTHVVKGEGSIQFEVQTSEPVVLVVMSTDGNKGRALELSRGPASEESDLFKVTFVATKPNQMTVTVAAAPGVTLLTTPFSVKAVRFPQRHVLMQVEFDTDDVEIKSDVIHAKRAGKQRPVDFASLPAESTYAFGNKSTLKVEKVPSEVTLLYPAAVSGKVATFGRAILDGDVNAKKEFEFLGNRCSLYLSNGLYIDTSGGTSQRINFKVIKADKSLTIRVVPPAGYTVVDPRPDTRTVYAANAKLDFRDLPELFVLKSPANLSIVNVPQQTLVKAWSGADGIYTESLLNDGYENYAVVGNRPYISAISRTQSGFQLFARSPVGNGIRILRPEPDVVVFVHDDGTGDFAKAKVTPDGKSILQDKQRVQLALPKPGFAGEGGTYTLTGPGTFEFAVKADKLRYHVSSLEGGRIVSTPLEAGKPITVGSGYAKATLALGTMPGTFTLTLAKAGAADVKHVPVLVTVHPDGKDKGAYLVHCRPDLANPPQSGAGIWPKRK